MNNLELPSVAWLTGRETYTESTAYGEVVVPSINIRLNPGGLSELGRFIGELPHGSSVTVVEKYKHEKEKRDYYKISVSEIVGWVPETFISWRWSRFTFFGRFLPLNACRELDLSTEYAGLQMRIKAGKFAVSTEGDPDNTDAIKNAIVKYADRITAAVGPLTTVSLRAEFDNWVAEPAESSAGKRIVGLNVEDEQLIKQVNNEHIETSQTIIPLMAQFPYLDLALSDFSQAMMYPQHAPIFLARAIEAIEYYFDHFAKKEKGVGKEKYMRRKLGVRESDVTYVTKLANQSHRRHASEEGKDEKLSDDDLALCYKKTSDIIAAFVGFLEGNTPNS
jgi:hypothetical protein